MKFLSLLKTALIAAVGLAAAAGIVIALLVFVFDLQWEMAGNSRPMFSFGSVDEHYDDLESNRSQHYSHLLPAPGVVDSDAQPYWTDFRGPQRDGHYTQQPLRTDWSDDGLSPIWKQPVGGGYASFTVAHNRAFTIEQRRDREAVVAYDADTGRELWVHEWEARFDEAMGGPGPRATPTWHDGRVYALGATGLLWCLDAATGEVIWHRDILADGSTANLRWAMSGAPLIVDDFVVVQPGGRIGWSVVAYDRHSGDVVWHALDDVQSYTSPMTITLNGVRQLVVVTAERALGMTIGDGSVLWEHSWTVPIVPNISQPLVVSDRRLFLSAGYGKGATVIEISGAVPPFSVEPIWVNNRMKNKFSSSVLHDGFIYGLDEAILACIDAETGQLQWKGGRYGYGQLLLAGDHLIVLTERGELALVEATPEQHVELAVSPAIEGKTWNVPAIADGRLLVRNTREMAAFDLRGP